MKRFWHISTAILLGVASLSSATAQQLGLQGANLPAAQQVQQNQIPQNQLNGINQAQGVNRIPGQGGVQELQANQQPNPLNGVNQAQGVNRVPGQGGLQELQRNQQILNDVQERDNNNNALAADPNAFNQLGALRNRFHRQAAGNMFQPSYSRQGMDQLMGSGPGFYPANLTSSYGGTSSIEEGILSGQGRLLQGAGEYNRNSAEALKAREQARALYLENARTGLKTYFELKEINAKYRAATAPLPLTKEKLDQWNREDQPERLTRREYNVDSGQIAWPAVLMTAPFDAERIQLEALFARRTANEFGAASDFYRMVHQDTERMSARLKDYLQTGEKFFSDQEYMAAKNFLASLANEARLAPDLQGLVAN